MSLTQDEYSKNHFSSKPLLPSAKLQKGAQSTGALQISKQLSSSALMKNNNSASTSRLFRLKQEKKTREKGGVRQPKSAGTKSRKKRQGTLDRRTMDFPGFGSSKTAEIEKTGAREAQASSLLRRRQRPIQTPAASESQKSLRKQRSPRTKTIRKKGDLQMFKNAVKNSSFNLSAERTISTREVSKPGAHEHKTPELDQSPDSGRSVMPRSTSNSSALKVCSDEFVLQSASSRLSRKDVVTDKPTQSTNQRSGKEYQTPAHSEYPAKKVLSPRTQKPSPLDTMSSSVVPSENEFVMQTLSSQHRRRNRMNNRLNAASRGNFGSTGLQLPLSEKIGRSSGSELDVHNKSPEFESEEKQKKYQDRFVSMIPHSSSQRSVGSLQGSHSVSSQRSDGEGSKLFKSSILKKKSYTTISSATANGGLTMRTLKASEREKSRSVNGGTLKRGKRQGSNLLMLSPDLSGNLKNKTKVITTLTRNSRASKASDGDSSVHSPAKTLWRSLTGTRKKGDNDSTVEFSNKSLSQEFRRIKKGRKVNKGKQLRAYREKTKHQIKSSTMGSALSIQMYKRPDLKKSDSPLSNQSSRNQDSYSMYTTSQDGEDSDCSSSEEEEVLSEIQDIEALRDFFKKKQAAGELVCKNKLFENEDDMQEKKERFRLKPLRKREGNISDPKLPPEHQAQDHRELQNRIESSEVASQLTMNSGVTESTLASARSEQSTNSDDFTADDLDNYSANMSMRHRHVPRSARSATSLPPASSRSLHRPRDTDTYSSATRSRLRKEKRMAAKLSATAKKGLNSSFYMFKKTAQRVAPAPRARPKYNDKSL